MTGKNEEFQIEFNEIRIEDFSIEVKIKNQKTIFERENFIILDKKNSRSIRSQNDEFQSEFNPKIRIEEKNKNKKTTVERQSSEF